MILSSIKKEQTGQPKIRIIQPEISLGELGLR
jgi:hypothetical protein